MAHRRALQRSQGCVVCLSVMFSHSFFPLLGTEKSRGVNRMLALRRRCCCFLCPWILFRRVGCAASALAERHRGCAARVCWGVCGCGVLVARVWCGRNARPFGVDVGPGSLRVFGVTGMRAPPAWTWGRLWSGAVEPCWWVGVQPTASVTSVGTRCPRPPASLWVARTWPRVVLVG